MNPGTDPLDRSGHSRINLSNSYNMDCSGITLHENPSSFTIFNTIRQSLLNATFKACLVGAGSTNGQANNVAGINNTSDIDENTLLNQIQVSLSRNFPILTIFNVIEVIFLLFQKSTFFAS